MKRTLMIILAAVAAVIVFGWLMHLVLVAANVNEPATTTVSGMTPRRVWATIVMVLGLVAVVIGGLALRQSAGRTGVGRGENGGHRGPGGGSDRSGQRRVESCRRKRWSRLRQRSNRWRS